jgi:hypothetical protein
VRLYHIARRLTSEEGRPCLCRGHRESPKFWNWGEGREDVKEIKRKSRWKCQVLRREGTDVETWGGPVYLSRGQN